MRKINIVKYILLFLYLISIESLTYAQTLSFSENEIEKDLSKLSPAELTRQKVISVSKKEEHASETPSAIFVITHDDIRRLGATSIPDILRIVPGFHVAAIDANKWAVTSRGFADQFANKLLVLIDGRSVYSPLFSGVYWDTQDLLIEDIEKMEVIRGPGGTIWGSNAVNGIINIITKHSSYTQGTSLSNSTGNKHVVSSGRYGGKFADKGYYRVYAKNSNYSSSRSENGGKANDKWYLNHSGFRIDMTKKTRTDSYVIEGDVYQGYKNWTYSLPTLTPPYTNISNYKEKIYGGNFLGKWAHTTENGIENTIQSYVSKAVRSNFSLHQDVTTFDFDLHSMFYANDYNEVSVGLGYRQMWYEFGLTDYIAAPSKSSTQKLISAFLQDKIPLIPKKLYLTLGSKFERNDFTGLEIQPSVKLAYFPADNNMIWGSVSRAVRTPGKFDNEATIIAGALKPGYMKYYSNPYIKSESVVSYELGYKTQPKEYISVDITTFYNEYKKLRSIEQGRIFIETDRFGNTYPILPLRLANNIKGKTYGVEVSNNISVTENWNLIGSYSYINIDLKTKNFSNDQSTVFDKGRTPHHQFNIRSQLDLPHDIEFDNALFFVDYFKVNSSTRTKIPKYIRFDTRFGWTPMYGLELALIGQNLFSKHKEFPDGLYSSGSSYSDRSVYFQVKLKF
jgi:iron complex outermembrane receptor protein